MIVTTSSKDERLIEKALRFSETYGIPYRVRGEKSLAYLYETEDRQVFVVNHNRGLSYYEEGKSEAFFHPNMAFHRLRNLRQGGIDMLAAVCGLEPGMTFLDGTLGLASDAMTAASVVGDGGRVIGTEKSLPLYILVREGLEFHAEKEPELRNIAARMELHHADNLDFLRTCADGSCDVIYFDFMPDFSVVLVDYNRPVFKDYLMPFGRLRDLPSRLSAADVLIVTKCPTYIDDEQRADWAS
ncbi:MAG: class I SAM-dependent methyltransferase, partial [Clostridia bacterium]|nr:class I SAM-dependent methyltransferase [Clostridia bacterium]